MISVELHLETVGYTATCLTPAWPITSKLYADVIHIQLSRSAGGIMKGGALCGRPVSAPNVSRLGKGTGVFALDDGDDGDAHQGDDDDDALLASLSSQGMQHLAT